MGEIGGTPKSTNAAELEFLTVLERGEIISQISLSRRIGVAVGLINAWLKLATSKGYVKARQAPYKRYAYYLTPKGFAEKSRLVAEYLHYSLHLFRRARSEYTDIFEAARRDGRERIVLVGSGELLEIAILTALAENISLLGILDPNTNKSHQFGVRVIQSLVEAGPIDAVIITEIRAPQAMYEGLIESLSADQVLFPPLLRITPECGLGQAATGGEVHE